MERSPVCWFEIYVQDMPRAKAFYERVLATELHTLPTPDGLGPMEMSAFPSTPESAGAGGALVKMPGLPSGGNSTIVYFACVDCAVEAGRVEASGGKIFKPKFSIGEHGYIALVHDTEGNMIGLYSMN